MNAVLWLHLVVNAVENSRITLAHHQQIVPSPAETELLSDSEHEKRYFTLILLFIQQPGCKSGTLTILSGMKLSTCGKSPKQLRLHQSKIPLPQCHKSQDHICLQGMMSIMTCSQPVSRHMLCWEGADICASHIPAVYAMVTYKMLRSEASNPFHGSSS